MPKQKNHSGLKKRVKISKTGKILRGCAFRSHLSAHKTHKQTVHLRKGAQVSKSDERRIKQLVAGVR